MTFSGLCFIVLNAQLKVGNYYSITTWPKKPKTKELEELDLALSSLSKTYIYVSPRRDLFTIWSFCISGIIISKDTGTVHFFEVWLPFRWII